LDLQNHAISSKSGNGKQYKYLNNYFCQSYRSCTGISATNLLQSLSHQTSDALCYNGITMRTTLTIDDDVLAAAKALADAQHKTTGEVLSALARQALQPPPQGRRYRNGFLLLEVKPGAVPVTMELVNQLRDDELP
jgi:hypothetical protein